MNVQRVLLFCLLSGEDRLPERLRDAEAHAEVLPTTRLTTSTLLFISPAAPLSRHSGLVGAEDLVLSGTAGQNLKFQCHLPFYGNRKLFCRGECVGGDVLIETTAREAHNGRYSIEYQGSYLFYGTLNVTIRHLTGSDSGRYTCGQCGILNFYQTVNLNIEDGEFLLNITNGIFGFSIHTTFKMRFNHSQHAMMNNFIHL